MRPRSAGPRSAHMRQPVCPTLRAQVCPTLRSAQWECSQLSAEARRGHQVPQRDSGCFQGERTVQRVHGRIELPIKCIRPTTFEDLRGMAQWVTKTAVDIPTSYLGVWESHAVMANQEKKTAGAAAQKIFWMGAHWAGPIQGFLQVKVMTVCERTRGSF